MPLTRLHPNYRNLPYSARTPDLAWFSGETGIVYYKGFLDESSSCCTSYQPLYVMISAMCCNGETYLLVVPYSVSSTKKIKVSDDLAVWRLNLGSLVLVSEHCLSPDTPVADDLTLESYQLRLETAFESAESTEGFSLTQTLFWDLDPQFLCCVDPGCGAHGYWDNENCQCVCEEGYELVASEFGGSICVEPPPPRNMPTLPGPSGTLRMWAVYTINGVEVAPYLLGTMTVYQEDELVFQHDNFFDYHDDLNQVRITHRITYNVGAFSSPGGSRDRDFGPIEAYNYVTYNVDTCEAVIGGSQSAKIYAGYYPEFDSSAELIYELLEPPVPPVKTDCTANPRLTLNFSIVGFSTSVSLSGTLPGLVYGAGQYFGAFSECGSYFSNTGSLPFFGISSSITISEPCES